MAQRGERKWNFGQQPPQQPQRDPRSSMHSAHYSQPPQRPGPSEKSVFEKDLIDERPLWVLSVYGESSHGRLFGNDTSFEEVRLHEMSLRAAGRPVDQIAAETDGYRQQALMTIQGFLEHRRRIEGGPQQNVSPRGRWTFGTTPGGRTQNDGGRGRVAVAVHSMLALEYPILDQVQRLRFSSRDECCASDAACVAAGTEA